MTRGTGLALLVGLVSTGCIVEVAFDPVGTAASVQGEWLVDGAPATPESCAAASITHVRVRFYEGERTFDHARLVFPCAEGGFDTRPERVVAAGTWNMQMLAVNNEAPVGESNVVGEGPLETIDTLDARGHIVLETASFTAPAP